MFWNIFSTKGILLYFEGDKILRKWPWSKDVDKYYSERFNRNFYSWIDYLKYVGASGSDIKSGNIIGFDINDILQDWVKAKFGRESVVVLTGINFDKKPKVFWERIPHIKKTVFSKDIVVLRCKDLGQLRQLVDSVDISFAEAFGYKGGELVYWNEDDNPRD